MRRGLYLKAGLAAILVLVGVKMLLLDVWKVPIWLSLTGIATILAVAVGLSLRATRHRSGEDRDPARDGITISIGAAHGDDDEPVAR